MDFLNKLKDRLAEPSSYAGIGFLLQGLNSLFDLHGVPQAAHAVAQAGAAVAAGANPMVAIATALAGVVAFFMPEKSTAPTAPKAP